MLESNQPKEVEHREARQSPSVTAVEERAELQSDDVDRLLSFADDVLPTLRRADGIFCFDRSFGAAELRGRSVRYSIIVLLGLLKQRAQGGSSRVEVEDLHRAILAEVSTLGIGDLSLLLWAETRMPPQQASDTLARLRTESGSESRLRELTGMEAAWFVLGTLHATACGRESQNLFHLAYTSLLARRAPSSPLFRHRGDGSWRAKLPNFATEIYTLLALAETARYGLAPNAGEYARALADKLIELRLPDAGWPWLFNADRATVVEPYEVYSVHQDAMAPMALFALAETVGEEAYARAAVQGFRWCFGRNELGFAFYDPTNRFAHRSIRRRGSAHLVNLVTNTGLGGVCGLTARTSLGGIEINSTCRPYHLGWILEAWAGRQQLNALVP